MTVGMRVRRLVLCGGLCAIWASAGPSVAEASFGFSLQIGGGYSSETGRFDAPEGLAVDPSTGDIYVADSSNDRVQKFDAQGNYLLQWRGADGGFRDPRAVALDPSTGDVYVTDRGHGRVQRFTSSGAYVSQFGRAGSGDGQFNDLEGIAVDPAGNVWVTDSGNNRVQKFNSSGAFVTRLGSVGSGNGQFRNPRGIAIERSTGNVYVADADNYRVQKFNSSGGYLSQFGSRGDGDGQFSGALGVAVDPVTNVVYVGDYSHPYVQKFDASGHYVGRFDGSSSDGWHSEFRSPQWVAVDPVTGVVWVSDGHPFGSYVRKFTGATGRQNDYLLDFGGGLSDPIGVAVQPGGDVYVVEYGNHRVKRFSSSGALLSQFGGLGSGDGQLHYPEGIGIDASTGNVYVADADNHRIEVFSALGEFVATWGWGVTDGQNAFQICTSNCRAGIAGSGNGQLNSPYRLAVDPVRHYVYVIDYQNRRVDRFDTAGHFLSQFQPGPNSYYPVPPHGVAVDPNSGQVHLAVGNAVIKYNASGSFAARTGNENTSGCGDNVWFAAQAVAVDAGTGAAYVLDCVRVQKLDAAMNWLTRFGRSEPGWPYSRAPGAFDDVTAVAVDSSTGDVYVADMHEGRVQKFGTGRPTSIIPPKVTKDGRVLRASPGRWQSPDALSFAYQWKRCDANGSGCADIADATGDTYRPTGGDAGRKITVAVSATDAQGRTGAAATAEPVGPVGTPPRVESPAADATGTEGETLTTSGRFTDPDGDPLTVTASGTTGTLSGSADGSWTWSWHAGDDVSPRTVVVTATDSLGYTATDSFDYSATNVAPTVTMDAGNATTVDAGAAHRTFRFRISDPGGDDTIESTATSCGASGAKVDGSDAHTSAGGSFECVFADGPAVSTVTARAVDDDGGAGDVATQDVKVRAAQAIEFAPQDDRRYGDEPFAVAPTASSGLPVDLTASGACALRDGRVALLEAGACDLRAEQAGDADSAPAEPVVRSFTVAPAPLTVSVHDERIVYGDTAPGPTVAFDGFVNGDGLADLGGAIAFDSPFVRPDAGAYELTASGLDSQDYAIAYVAGTLTVEKAPLATQPADAARRYGAADPAIAVQLTGVVDGDDISAHGTTTTGPRTPVGTYPIHAGFADPDGRLANYAVDARPAELTVEKAPLVAAAGSAERVYGRGNPELTGTLTGVVEGDDITAAWTTTASRTTDVGTVAIVPEISDPDDRLPNYDVERRNGGLTITKAGLSVAAHNQARDYGDANPELTGTLTGVVEGDAIDAVYAVGADRASNVGSYTITADVADPGDRLGNYDVTRADGTLTVRRRALTAKADDVRWRFGDERPRLTGTLTGAVNDDAVDATYTSDAAPARNDVPAAYPIAVHVTGSDAVLANYAVTEMPGTLSVFDGYAPELTVAGDMTVEATGPGGATVPWTAAAGDDVDRDPDVACTPASPATFTIGVHMVSCTATDTAGNATTTSFGVAIRDTTAPKLTVPLSFAVDATAPDGASVPFSASAADVVEGDRPVTCTRAFDGAAQPVDSGATFAVGDTVVACRASDTRGNAATEAFTVTVRSATEQAEQIGGLVTSMQLEPGTSSQLEQKADAIVTALVASSAEPCNDLKTFDNYVNAKAGKRKGLSTEQADELYDTTARIRSAIGGCRR